MSVYRYVKRMGNEPSSVDASSAVDITLTNPDFKAELDRTMDRMGFEFAGSREERLNAVAPGFPTSAAPLHFDPSDRPTPVARSPGPLPVQGPPFEPAANVMDQAFDAAALEIAPSWQGVRGLQEEELRAPTASPPTRASAVMASLPRLAELGRKWMWAAAALVPVFLVQAGVLGAAPSTDDFIRLYDGAANGFVHVVAAQQGVHSFPLARAVVWLLNLAFALHTGLLYSFPLALHLACTDVLRRILVAMTGRAGVAAGTAALWGISPLHRATLGSIYSVGAVAASLCALVVVHRLVKAREHGDPLSPLELVGFNGLLVGGALASSSGAPLALAMPFVVLLYLARESPVRRAALGLAPAAVISVAAYVLVRLFGPPEPLGKFIRGVPLFLELGGYGVGNYFAGPFVVMASDGESAALVGNPGSGAAVVFASAVAFLVATAAGWAIARGPGGLGRRVCAFVLVPALVYLVDAFDGAKYVARDGVAALAIRSEPHYAGMLGIALAVGLLAAQAKPLSFRRAFLAPAIQASVALLATLLAWSASANVENRRASRAKGVEDVERAFERAAGVTEEGHDAYLENVDFPLVPRSTVGRDRIRFPGLLAYFALAHPGGELAGRNVRFVEGDGKLVARIRETAKAKIAALVESADEARQKGHAVTTPRLSRQTAGPSPELSATPRRRPVAPRDRKKLPFAKP